MDLSDEELLELAEQVLTGELMRSQLAPLPARSLAYVAFTMMYALRYHLNDADQPTERLTRLLADLVLKDTNFRTTAPRLREHGRQLGLFQPRERPEEEHLFLTLPPALVELINAHQDNPAIEAFRRDVEKAREQHTAQLQKGVRESDLGS